MSSCSSRWISASFKCARAASLEESIQFQRNTLWEQQNQEGDISRRRHPLIPII